MLKHYENALIMGFRAENSDRQTMSNHSTLPILLRSCGTSFAMALPSHDPPGQK